MTSSLVGVLELSSKYRYGLTSRGAPLYLFRPYNEEQPEMIVGCSHRDTAHDQIAVVTPPPGPPSPGKKGRGTLLRLIGQVGSPEAERIGLLEHYCPTRTYSRDMPYIDESDDPFREEISAATGWLTFHIDPPGCRDIDDALAWNPLTQCWAITIADAAAAVPFVSELNASAREIGETFYSTMGEVKRSMLPPTISEEHASLLPGQRRRGVTYFFGPEGYSDRWALTWITVEHSLTYDSFPTSDVARQLSGSDYDAHHLVTSMMILYNRRAAELLKRVAPTAGILRVQSAPDAEALQAWTTIDPALARMAHEAATYEFVVADDHDQSHAGLAVNAYCHATSPLRRYADLANQRLIKAHINGGIVGTSETMGLCDHLNGRTRAARRWARDLLFLEKVTPGRIHELSVVWVDGSRVWVPEWSRLLRLRHEIPDPAPGPGTKGRIRIFCDPTKRNWRRRILTAAALAEVD
jgi:exoribonuclease R